VATNGRTIACFDAMCRKVVWIGKCGENLGKKL
jgi:hypothetical protein